MGNFFPCWNSEDDQPVSKQINRSPQAKVSANRQTQTHRTLIKKIDNNYNTKNTQLKQGVNNTNISKKEQTIKQSINTQTNIIQIKKPVRQRMKYNITNENLQQKIIEASTMRDNQQAINLFTQISSFITQTNDKSFLMMEKLAYVQASLAQLCFTNTKECEEHQNKALGIYSQFQSEYFEEIVVLLNNKALRNQQQKEFSKAIEKYQSILQLQKKYYSINDERRLLSMNNLACAYFEAKRPDEGIMLFKQIFNIMKQHECSRQIMNLVEGNNKFYKKNKR